MHRTPCFSIGLAAVASIFAAPGFAADAGFYLTATVGQAEEDPRSIGTNFFIGFPFVEIVHIDPDRVAVDESVAWSVAVGYRLNAYFAAEVEYIDFGSADITEHYTLGPPLSPPFPDELTRRYASKVKGPALSVLGSLPVGEGLDAFLRAGVLFADRELEIPQSIGLDDKFGSTVWLAGAGVDWSFANRWAIRAEYQRTGKLDETFLAGETELERMSLSVLFRL
jgi:OmpA-OmpF porin, OOP family